MRFVPVLPFAVLLGACLGAPSAVSAQRGLSGLEVTAGWAGWSGDELDDLEPGVRLQVGFMSGAGNRVGLGVTGSWGFSGSESTGADATEMGLGMTARYAVLGDPRGSNAHVEAHVGWTRLKMDIPEGELDVQVDGFTAGPGVGVAVPLTTRLTLLGGADWHWVTFQNDPFSGTPAEAGPTDNGWRWGVSAGVSVTTGGRRGG